jgi:DNA-binding LacI/PurR family transcriptional regulator
MRQLLKLDPRPDAVFAYNDAAALAAMRVCQASGLRVPDDIALAGFDDLPAASYAPVPLTSVRIDTEALGRTGVKLLVEGDAMPQEVDLPVALVERQSSGGKRTAVSTARAGRVPRAPSDARGPREADRRRG